MGTSQPDCKRAGANKGIFHESIDWVLCFLHQAFYHLLSFPRIFIAIALVYPKNRKDTMKVSFIIKIGKRLIRKMVFNL